MEAKYTPIRPEGIFNAKVTRTLVPDSATRLHYEYTYTLELRPTGCCFIDHLAQLVSRHGKRDARVYAALMGIRPEQLAVTLRTLSGVGISEWQEICLLGLCDTLLKETDWTIKKIAATAHFTSGSAFSHFFHSARKCSPQEWRRRQRIK
jgi:AraC-like DNA-binding protein